MLGLDEGGKVGLGAMRAAWVRGLATDTWGLPTSATASPVAPSGRSTCISEICRSPEETDWEVEDSSWGAVWGAGELDTGAADSAPGGATGTWEICLACVVSSCSCSDCGARSIEILRSAACAGIPPCSAKSCWYCSDVRGTSSCKITR